MANERPVVCFSAGDPPPGDLVKRGLGAIHLDDGVLRVARSILRHNLDIAYAGYLRGGGFTADLADDTGKVVLGPRFVSFLGWPYSKELTTTRIADTLGLCRYVLVPPGFSTENIEPFFDIPKFAWAMARATTATRQQLLSTQACVDVNGEEVGPRIAVVLFAGKSKGFLGIMPGIAEEAYCAIESKLAVYIVGAFGGAARLLAESVTGPKTADAFTFKANEGDANFDRMKKGAIEAGCGDEPEDAFRRLGATLESVRGDLGRLNNGLGADENRELMLTGDLGKVIRLITKGLSKSHQD
jgi:hypothetical protein